MTKSQKYWMFCEAMMRHSDYANCVWTFGKQMERGMDDPASVRHAQQVTLLAKEQLRQKWLPHRRPEHEFAELVSKVKDFVSEMHQYEGMRKLQSLV